MEQTKIELSGLKLLCEKNEAKKQELEGKANMRFKIYNITSM
jgi:hypothetical protein